MASAVSELDVQMSYGRCGTSTSMDHQRRGLLFQSPCTIDIIMIGGANWGFDYVV